MPISFLQANAVALPFKENSFNAAVFSFNGFMQIPGLNNRLAALNEIHRILAPSGIFIFTTHERKAKGQFKALWKEEAVLWNNGQHDQRLHEFGDRIVNGTNNERGIFLHIPDQAEVKTLLRQSGFRILMVKNRNRIAAEPHRVLQFSKNCLFWVGKKERKKGK